MSPICRMQILLLVWVPLEHLLVDQFKNFDIIFMKNIKSY